MSLISIIVPSINEDIAAALSRLGDHLAHIADHSFEILVVDDSREPHLTRVREDIAAFTAQPRQRVRAALVVGPRTGKGAAIRAGAEASRGEIVFIIDCDLPVRLEHIEQFIETIVRDDADVVMAERPLKREFGSPARYVLSRGLLVLQRTLVFHSAKYRDTQCGFKAYRGDLLRALVKNQIVSGGMYDLEYLYAAGDRGARIVTVPVVPNPDTRPSKINIWRCIVQDPVDVARVKWKGVRGGYR